MGLLYAKEMCQYLLPFEHNVHECDRQTDHGIVTSIAIHEIDCQSLA